MSFTYQKCHLKKCIYWLEKAQLNHDVQGISAESESPLPADVGSWAHLASALYSSLSCHEPSSSAVHECPPRRGSVRSCWRHISAQIWAGRPREFPGWGTLWRWVGGVSLNTSAPHKELTSVLLPASPAPYCVRACRWRAVSTNQRWVQYQPSQWASGWSRTLQLWTLVLRSGVFSFKQF